MKALVADPAHQAAMEFIVNRLCGRHRLSFVGAKAAEMMFWLEGRRYCGEMIMRLSERPVVEPDVAAEPPARTMTERAERRRRSAK